MDEQLAVASGVSAGGERKKRSAPKDISAASPARVASGRGRTPLTSTLLLTARRPQSPAAKKAARKKKGASPAREEDGASLSPVRMTA